MKYLIWWANLNSLILHWEWWNPRSCGQSEGICVWSKIDLWSSNSLTLLIEKIPYFVSVLHFVEPFFAARLLAEREHLSSMSMHGKSKLPSMLGILTFKTMYSLSFEMLWRPWPYWPYTWLSLYANALSHVRHWVSGCCGVKFSKDLEWHVGFKRLTSAS